MTQQDRGKWLATATALFFSWAALTMGVRVWVKARKQRWSHDDTAICAAVIMIVLHVAMTLWAVSDGYGRPIDDISVSVRGAIDGALYASQLSYVLAIGLTRVSAALFVGHLTRYLPQVRNAYILTGVCGVWTVASCLVIALRGNLSEPWTTFDTDQAMWIRWVAVGASGLALEVAIWLMSISLIWGLQMKLEKRLIILGAFGCRLGLIPIVIIRILYLAPSRNTNPTESSVFPGIMTEAAVEFALFASSVTALKPFLRPFHTGAIVNTVGGAGSGLAYGSQHPYMLGASRDANGEYRANITTITANESDTDLPGSPPCSPKSQGHGFSLKPGANPTEDIESASADDASDDMIIRTARDWSVRYEDQINAGIDNHQ